MEKKKNLTNLHDLKGLKNDLGSVENKKEKSKQRQVIARRHVSNSGKSMIESIMLIDEDGKIEMLKPKIVPLTVVAQPGQFLGEEELLLGDFAKEFDDWKKRIEKNKSIEKGKIEFERFHKEKKAQREAIKKIAIGASLEKINKVLDLIASLSPYLKRPENVREKDIEAEIIKILNSVGFQNVSFEEYTLYIDGEDFCLGCRDDGYGCMNSHEGYEKLKKLFKGEVL